MAYLATDKPSSIEDFAECTTRAVKDFCAEYGVPEPRILVEPGRSLVANAGVTLHIRQLAGENTHHVIEGMFKAVARAMRQACEPDPRMGDALPSTKGML